MNSKRWRLDRFISVKKNINRRDVRLLLAQKRIYVNDTLATDIHQLIDDFSYIVMDQEILQNNIPLYIMMNKPIGVVSATKDEQHKTVIDLIDHPMRHELHIVGRLDLNSSGLILLTNDGQWSKKLTHPENKVIKHYRVHVEQPLSEDYVPAFENGMYFPYEGITTQPAALKIINGHEAHVYLHEGRYHQIKRMFGRFRNPVLALHRLSIGQLALDSHLAPGESRELTKKELSTIFL